MDSNLIDILKDKIGGRITRDVGDVIKIPSEDIEESLNYIFPALLGKLISKVQGVDDAHHLMEYLDSQGYDGSILQWLEGAFSGGPLTTLIMDIGKKATNYLIGEDQSQYIQTITEFSKLNLKQVSQLTDLVSPLFLSQMQSTIKSKNFTPENTYKYLSEQKDIAIRQTPSKLFDKLGLHKMLTNEEQEKPETIVKNPQVVEKIDYEPKQTFSSLLISLIPIVMLLAGLTLIFIYIQNYNERIAEELFDLDQKLNDDEILSGKPILSWGLPNGTELTAPENSTLDELMKYLYGTSQSKKTEEKTFTVQSDLINEELDTLRENANLFTSKLATIMKAYPQMEVKFNIYIPQQNATTKVKIGSQLKNYLVNNGIEGDRVTWQTGPKQSIGGGDNYILELVARLPNIKEESNKPQ